MIFGPGLRWRGQWLACTLVMTMTHITASDTFPHNALDLQEYTNNVSASVLILLRTTQQPKPKKKKTLQNAHFLREERDYSPNSHGNRNELVTAAADSHISLNMLGLPAVGLSQ